MIIFDLDGTLANCEHRRHFVDASYRDDCYFLYLSTLTQRKGWYYKERFKMSEPPQPMKFQPDYKSFNEACDADIGILSTIKIFDSLRSRNELHIWSARCESQKEKTKKWFDSNFSQEANLHDFSLKMRPIGDSTPDDDLKEKWLDEALEEGKTIDFVFDDRPKVVEMYRKRGIFVFDCNQSGRRF